MSRYDINSLKIATPCTADWTKMKGNERVRHCGECKMNVYNISQMSKAEAEELMHRAAGGQRVCMRFMRRHDGTVITQDCPVGVRIARRLKMKAAALRLTATAALLWIVGLAGQARSDEKARPMIMGKIAAPSHGDGRGDIKKMYPYTPGEEGEGHEAAAEDDRLMMGEMVAPEVMGGIAPPVTETEEN